LRLRKGDSFAVVHEEASDYDVFKKYFDLLDDILTKDGLKDRPSQIYNCDESGMPLQHKIPKVISMKGAKKICQVSSGNKTQITILGYASATGQVILPMVVFTGKHLMLCYPKEKSLEHFMVYQQMGGWIRSYFLSGFLRISSHMFFSERPILLMLDGHSSHYTLGLVKAAAAAAAKDVIIFCLPPHMTADSQPLDTSCFGPLKTYWFEICHRYLLTFLSM